MTRGLAAGALALLVVAASMPALSQGGAKVAYFEGTPIPTSVILTAVLALAGWQGRLDEAIYWGSVDIAGWTLHPLVLLFALSGTLMISKTLRIPKW